MTCLNLHACRCFFFLLPPTPCPPLPSSVLDVLLSTFCSVQLCRRRYFTSYLSVCMMLDSMFCSLSVHTTASRDHHCEMCVGLACAEMELRKDHRGTALVKDLLRQLVAAHDIPSAFSVLSAVASHASIGQLCLSVWAMLVFFCRFCTNVSCLTFLSHGLKCTVLQKKFLKVLK